MARPFTITTYGNAQLDTDYSALNSQSSLILDGTGDYITIPNDIIDSAGNRWFDLGTGGGYTYAGGDGWRIDFWFKHGAGFSESDKLLSSTSSDAGDGWYLQADLVLKNSYGTFTPNTLLFNNNINYDDWNKVTVLSNGEYGQIFLNGNRIFSSSQQYLGTLLNGGSVVVVGAKKLPNGTVSNEFIGWIDELRFSNSRSPDDTSNSTVSVETSQYTYSTSDLLLLHFNGTDGSTTIVDTTSPTTHSASANLSGQFTQQATQNPNPSMVFLCNNAYTWDDTDTWDNHFINGHWCAEERFDLTFTLTAEADDFDIASSLLFGEFGLQATANLLAASSAQLDSTTDFSAKAGFLVQVNELYDYTWDTVPEDIWNAFLSDRWEPRGWFAFSDIELEVIVGRELNASAELASAFGLTSGSDNYKSASATLEAFVAEIATGRTSDVRASAELSASFELTSDSRLSDVRASAELSASFELTSDSRLSDVRASASLDSAFGLTSGSDNYKSADAALEVVADLSSSSIVDHKAESRLDAEFNTSITGRILKFASLEFVAFGEMSVTAEVEHNASSTLNSSTTLSASAGYLRSGRLEAQGTFVVQVSADKLAGSGTELAAEFTQEAKGGLVKQFSARLDAFATELTVGERLPGGKATLSSVFTVSADANMTLVGQARLDAFASELAAGKISNVRASATLASAFNTEFAGDLKLLDSQFVYKVLHETRIFGVESETGILVVLPEDRIFDVESETRGYQVLQENRMIDVGYLMQ